jgi:phosphate-selective porin OprO/OprP
MGRARFCAALLGAAVSLAVPGIAPAAGSLSDLLVRKGVITQEEAAGVGGVKHGPSFGLATADGAFSLTLYGYGQVRYTLTDNDGSTNTSNFSVQRARLGVKGHAFGPDLSYKLYLNVYSGKANASVSLFDLYADYAVNPHLALKAGQYKVPYAVQWNVSAAQLQFVERGIVDGYFRLDRDTGLSAHGTVTKGVNYDVGVFNGEGTNQSNPDTHHLWVARLTTTPLGAFAPHESDTDRSEEWRLLLVAGAAHDDHVASHSIAALGSRLTALGASDLTAVNLFAGVRRGGGEARAEYHRRFLDPAAAGMRTETAEGLSVQAGYFVAKNLEMAVRYGHLDPNTHTGGDLKREAGVAVSRHFAGHRSKLQADLFRTHTQTGPGTATDDNRLRVQYQIAF